MPEPDVMSMLREVETLSTELVKRVEWMVGVSSSFEEERWRQAAATVRRVRKQARRCSDTRRRAMKYRQREAR